MDAELDFWLKMFGLGGLGSIVGAAGIAFTMWLRGYKVVSHFKLQTTAADDERDERSYAHLENQLKTLQQSFNAQRDSAAAMLREHNDSTKAMLEEHVECREDLAELHAICHFLQEQSVRMHATLVVAGLNPPPLMAFPKPRESRRDSDTEFKFRESAQKLVNKAEELESLSAYTVGGSQAAGIILANEATRLDSQGGLD